MPTMPRAMKNGKIKAARINWKIIGKPSALQFKHSKEQAQINEQLLYQETSRVR